MPKKGFHRWTPQKIASQKTPIFCFLVFFSPWFFYHSPRKHYLPEKKYFWIIFRLPFHDFDFFELILENYPIPIAFVWVVRHYPVGTPVLVELFFITVTRFEIFRINWVMFSWQMGVMARHRLASSRRQANVVGSQDSFFAARIHSGMPPEICRTLKST